MPLVACFYVQRFFEIFPALNAFAGISWKKSMEVSIENQFFQMTTI
jgi:hypothetical protein